MPTTPIRRRSPWLWVSIVIGLAALALASDQSRVADVLVEEKGEELEASFQVRFDQLEAEHERLSKRLRSRPARLHRKVIVSPRYEIDELYASMMGPSAMQEFRLTDANPPELLWLVGYRTSVVDAKDGAEVSQEFMCHANLDIDRVAYEASFGGQETSARLFTLSQGQQTIRFPAGFAIPVMSSHGLKLITQVLNLNLPEPHNLGVRHRVVVEFYRDAEMLMPPRALYLRGVQVLKAMSPDAHYYGLVDSAATEETHGPGCEVGTTAHDGQVLKDALGRPFTAHWKVKPGHEVSRTDATGWLDLKVDRRVHYAAVHLHPYAESLELYDHTANRSVWKAAARPSIRRIGLDRIDAYSSASGFMLYAGHRYEVVSRYHNTTDQDVDAMAVMFLYIANPEFEARAF